MPQAKSKSTKADCWAEIDRLVREPQLKGPQGDGWLTKAQLAKRWAVSVATATRRIGELRHAGKLDMCYGGAKNSDGVGYCIAYYRPKSK